MISLTEQELRMIHQVLLELSPCTLDEYAELWSVDLDNLLDRFDKVVPFVEP